MHKCLSVGQEDNMTEIIATIHDTICMRFMGIDESADELSAHLNSDIYLAEKLNLCEVMLIKAIENLADTVQNISQAQIHVKDISETTRKLEDANAFIRAAAESVNYLLAARLGVSDVIDRKKDKTE
jgi:hypothetical protein